MRGASQLLPLCLMTAVGCGSGGPTAPPVAAAPAPTPTPIPTPTPASLGQGLGCGLPAMRECGGSEGPPGVYGCCVRETVRGDFASLVDQSIEIVMREQPRLFDGTRVLDREAYLAAVAHAIEERFGACSKPGQPGDEVGVKNTNAYSEQYDIYLSNGRVRIPAGFVASCRPARF